MANEKLVRHLQHKRIEFAYRRMLACCARFNYQAALEARDQMDAELDQLARQVRRDAATSAHPG